LDLKEKKAEGMISTADRKFAGLRTMIRGFPACRLFTGKVIRKKHAGHQERRAGENRPALTRHGNPKGVIPI